MTRRRFRFRAGWFWLAAALVALHVVVLCAAFFAPYRPDSQNLDFAYAPPMRLHWFDARGRFHLRPFVYPLQPVNGPPGVLAYHPDLSRRLPLHFFVWRRRRLAGRVIGSHLHLFGVASRDRVFLLGADGYGRDLFSRLLFGGQISLFAGLLAASLSLLLGLFLGGLAGFYGGWADELLMRTADVSMALPWIYLLFAVRNLLPLGIAPRPAFLLLVAIIGLTGWARPARLVRGVALSAGQREYVHAARGFGASGWYLLRRHVLPEAFPVALTQAALLAPQYILAEVTLSFLGLGVAQPVPSWGNLLAGLQKLYVLDHCWWMFAPGLAMILVFLLYYSLADALHSRFRETLA